MPQYLRSLRISEKVDQNTMTTIMYFIFCVKYVSYCFVHMFDSKQPTNYSKSIKSVYVCIYVYVTYRASKHNGLSVE